MHSKSLVNIICIFLLVLIFISKISFSFLGLIPNQLSFIIYQNGMHPYVNFLIHVLVVPFCFWHSFKHPPGYKLKSEYKILLVSLIFILIFQTTVQAFLINTDQSILFQFLGLLMAIVLIGIYGIFIPLYLDGDKFISIIRNITTSLTLISLILLVCGLHVFKGGRFVGIFKHIPHMVSVSVIAFIFYFPNFYKFNQKRILKIVFILLLIFTIFLTATKTSIVAMSLAISLGIFIFPTTIRKKALFKVTLILSLLSILFFLSEPISNYLYDVSTGKAELGYRRAQNGVETRMEEAQRGLDLFQKSPLFGLGLLYKFFKKGQEEVDVDQYNSFKDPHNIFASSAVIGGCPLFLFTIFALISMLISSTRGIKSKCNSTKLISLYLLCHIPILIIYHAHFSLGGIADRFYWLIFGYMGITRRIY